MEKPLTDLTLGQRGTIINVQGGRGMRSRLQSLGLANGQIVRKVSHLAWGGPVVVEVNRTQIAIGRGMANKIIVRCS